MVRPARSRISSGNIHDDPVETQKKRLRNIVCEAKPIFLTDFC